MTQQGRLVIAGLLLACGLSGVGSAQATTVSKEGFTSTVTETVAPTRLPAKGTAPVTLNLTVRSTRNTPGTPPRLTLQGIKVRTDRQITMDTEGLPTCPIGKIGGLNPREARQRCGTALIGTGTLTAVHQFPEQPAYTERYSLLAFNTIVGDKPQILLYNYLQGTIGITDTVGDPRAFGFSIVDFDITASLVMQLKLGATWTSKGKRHSYLNGACATGSFKNKVSLVMSNGVVTGATPQRCMKRG